MRLHAISHENARFHSNRVDMWNWLELCARYQPPRTCWGGHGHGCSAEGGEGVEGGGGG